VSTDPAAVLPAAYTFTGADGGTHTFSVTLRTAGTRSVTATDTVTPSITGSQNAIVVNPGSATQLTVSGLPQRADHELIIEVLAELLEQPLKELALAAQPDKSK